jgi:hypothetical protein
VGASVPRIDCWESEAKRQFWTTTDVDVIDAHPGLIYDAYAHSATFSAVCEATMNSSGLLEHLSTASHARDMLEILNQSGHEKLRYWGVSYGTILGGTFAGMFPDRVERLVSDGIFTFSVKLLWSLHDANPMSGNIDYYDWFNLDHTNFFADADKIMDGFHTSCYTAGPQKCAFHAESSVAVQKRLQKLLTSLKMSPVLVTGAEQAGLYMPELVTYSKVQRLISRTFYKPHFKFEKLAQVFADLEEGDGLSFLSMWADFESGPGPRGFCSLNDTSPYVPMDVDYWDDAFAAIMCSDGEPLDETPAEFEKYADRILGIGKATGAANVYFRVACAGRTVRPKYRFTGMEAAANSWQRKSPLTNHRRTFQHNHRPPNTLHRQYGR